VPVDGADDGDQKTRNGCCPAASVRIHEVVPLVCPTRPVQVLARAVEAREGLFVERQASGASLQPLHRVHDDLLWSTARLASSKTGPAQLAGCLPRCAGSWRNAHLEELLLHVVHV
jgi:hypothetical protein